MRDENGEHLTVEVFWHQNGWFWRRVENRQPHGEATGPFTTSTEAYESAKTGAKRTE